MFEGASDEVGSDEVFSVIACLFSSIRYSLEGG